MRSIRVMGGVGVPLAAVGLVVSGCGGGSPAPAVWGTGVMVTSTAEATATAPASAARAAARARVFFGHQSVGMNLLTALPAAFTAAGVTAPPVAENGTRPGPSGGFVAHAFIGENGDPVSKIKDFEDRVRGGVGKQVDVALMKLCYVDITRDTDVAAVFARYREALAGLERDFPKVAFVKVTVPLTTAVGRGAADNVARETFNALMRAQYTGKRLFDLAAVESTNPQGVRVASAEGGRPFFALYDGYAADEGHLNGSGALRAASAWLTAIAQATP